MHPHIVGAFSMTVYMTLYIAMAAFINIIKAAIVMYIAMAAFIEL